MGSKYVYPGLDLLSSHYEKEQNKVDLQQKAKMIEDLFALYKIDVTVNEIFVGPLVTEFAISIADGIRIKKILDLKKDLMMRLGYSYMNIEFPVLGKPEIGIDVPSDNRYILSLRTVMESNQFQNTKKGASFAIGKNMQNRVLMGDITDYPHMLVGGSTGTGKSCFVDSFILSLVYKYSPEEIQFIMVDSKGAGLSIYNDLPHMAMPAIKDIELSFQIFGWLKKKMNKRFQEFNKYGVRKLQSYNSIMESRGLRKRPYIILIIDDIATFMKVAPEKTKNDIKAIVLKARAAGIYLLFVTSNPTSNILTPEIKANLRSQFAFRVNNATESNNIVGSAGAEKILNTGECLFMCPLRYNLGHVQTPYVSTSDITNVVSYVAEKNKGKFKSEVEMDEVMREETGALF